MKHQNNKQNKDLILISRYFNDLRHELRNYIFDSPAIDGYLCNSTGGNYYDL